MKLHPKKITALGLLLLLAIPVFFSLATLVKQKIIQLQRTDRLENELLKTISISAEKLCWIKLGKEVLVDGKLFDVKSFKTSGTNILLTCFFDEKEDNLVKQINNLIGQKKESSSPFSQLAVKFLFAPVYNEPGSFSIQNPWHIIARQFSTYTEVVSTGYHPAFTPPPEFS